MGEDLLAWHKLLGLSLEDFFLDSCYQVITERDLAVRKQLLDILLLLNRKGGERRPLPDGLDDLAHYNLISFKSLREPMDAWALDELVGHYVNLRKQETKNGDKLRNISLFRLIALSTRFPSKLQRRHTLHRRREGVYDILWGSRKIRLIVLSEIPMDPHNAIWNIFSGHAEKVGYGANHLHWNKRSSTKLINRLFFRYHVEGMDMTYTLADFHRDTVQEIIADLSAEEQIKFCAKIPMEKRLATLTVEEKLKLLADVPAEEQLSLIRHLPLETQTRAFNEFLGKLDPKLKQQLAKTLSSESDS